MRIGTREKEIIKLIGLGVLVTISLVAPNFPMVLKPFIAKRRGRERFKSVIRKLEEKDVIYLGGDRIKLTEKGEKIRREIQIEDIKKIKKPEKWDGIWRIVAYDIPDRRKKHRDYFRLKLKELGFVQIQESLWVFPYDCNEEIAVLSQNLGISPYVVFMVGQKIPRESKIKQTFKL